MRNYHHFIKGFKSVPILCLFAALSLCCKITMAQSVSINTNIIPPYSPFYADYAGANASKVLLTITNLTAVQKRIKLVGQLQGDNGIKITTKSNYVPLQPVILNSNETKQLNGLALKDIFDLNSLNVYGIDKVRLVQTSRLPEGNYVFCIQAVDMNTNQVISATAPLGCTNISIAYPDAPVLINPLSNLTLFATNPQSLVFNWINAGFIPMGTQYTLQVAEMPLASSNPNQVLNSASFPLINKTMNSLSYTLSPSDPPLKTGKSYAWRIKAFDPMGKTVFKNNGTSQANVFTYAVPQLTLAAPVITSPQSKVEFTEVRNAYNVLNQPNIDISWNGSIANNAQIKYTIKIAKVGANDNAENALATNSGLIVNDEINTTAYTLKALPAAGKLPFDNSNKEITGVSGKATLEPDATYAIQVTAKGVDAYGKNINFTNFGNSEIVFFKYNGAPKLPPVVDNMVTITGRLLYRYKKENEQPNNTSFNFPPAYVTKKIGNFSSLVPNDAPLPDFICNGMYNQDNETRPVKNTAIKLVYALFTSATKAPTQYSELKSYDSENAPFTTPVGTSNYVDPEKKPDKVLVTGTTDENGNFSVSFFNNMKTGLIEKVDKSVEFGALRIAMGEDKYTNSDVIIFPQNGKTIRLPDEVVFADSYNLKVTVRTDEKIADQALQPGAVVAGYPVQLAVLKSDYRTEPSYPVESNIEVYKGLEANILGQPATVLDLGKTDANGQIVFKRLLTNDYYNIKASDQKYTLALESKLEGNFAYETQTKLIKNDACNNCPHHEVNYKLSKRSSVNKIGSMVREVVISPKNPEIYLRAMTMQNNMPKAIANATVTVYEYATDKSIFPSSKEYKTDVNGYLHLKDLAITTEKQGNLTKVIGPLRSIVISKPGYASLTISSKQKLSFGERFPAQVEQYMKGGGELVGHVVNEKGEPVVCNIRIAGGPFIKTADNGWFDIKNTASGNFTLIEVVPVVDNYFPEALRNNINTGDYTLVSNVNDPTGKIVVKEKLHRVRFRIVDENNNPVAESCTSVGQSLNVCYPSDSKTGLTNEIAVASPDNEFHIRVVAYGYVTYDSYKNIPISKTSEVIPIQLVRAKTIVGYVLDEKTNKPIKNARVYTISGTNQDGQVQNETFTDEKGYYILPGAVNQSMFFDYNSGLNFQSPIDVYAVKSGDDGYQSQKQTVLFGYGIGPNTVSNVVFKLTSLNMKAEIWGIPIEVNSVEEGSTPFALKISGAFVKIPDNATFKTALSNARLPFKNLQVYVDKKTNPNGTPNYVFAPTTNEIAVQTNAFKIMAFNKFSCEVLGSDQFFQYPLLKIIKGKNGLGVLNGFVTSELASFNFSYSYNGRFLFDHDKGQFSSQALPSTPIDVLGAVNSFTPLSKYSLKALYGVSSFKVHDFEATMLKGSYVNSDGFAINTAIKMQIPLVGISSLHAGSVQVSQKNIAWQDYVGDITIPLEKWTIRGKGLQYELNKGGFKIIGGQLQTDLPNVPLNEMLIMPTAIDLSTNNLSGNEVLTLGNVTPLKLVGGAKMTLNYDAAAPFDQKPHYRVNLSGGNYQRVAYIANIPGISALDKIDIEIMSAYSDGIHSTVNVTPVKHPFFNVISQTISGIEVGKDYFTLVGNTSLDMPGANNNVTGRFRYYKDQNGSIQQVTEKLQTDVEMPGKVKFNGTSFTLSNGVFKATGDLLIYKNTLADAITLHGTITKTGTGTQMDILPKDKIKMGNSANRYMTVLNGGNKVEGNAWSLVRFTAKPENFLADGKEILVKGQDEIDFIVNGSIDNDKKSSKQIKVEGVQTPFGGLDISFDFDKKILAGSLQFSGLNIPVGPVNLHDGKVNMQIDGSGFILCGAISNASFTPLPILKGFKSGVAIGFYTGPLPGYMKQDLLNVTLYNQLPDLEQGLTGVYVNVMKSLGKADLPKLPGPSLDDIPGLSGFVPTFDFSAGIDMRIMANLKSGVTIGGKAIANASCLYNFDVCKIGLTGSASGEFGLTYDGGLGGYLQFAVKGGLVYCVGSKELGLLLRLDKPPGGGFSPSVKLN